LPARLQRMCKDFQEITGFTVVTSLSNADTGIGTALPLHPPVHPLCIEQIRTSGNSPCVEQWNHPIRVSMSSRSSHSHSCYLGLRCSYVPIILGDVFVGVAKFVVDRSVSADAFSSATATLALNVCLACQKSHVSALCDELKAARGLLCGFQQLKSNDGQPFDDLDEGTASPDNEKHANGDGTVVDQILDYLHHHFTNADLSLTSVAAALELNSNYITQRFTKIVGQRMRSYIIALRVDRASHELLSTELSIRQIAHESGFHNATCFSRVFHDRVGVSPTEYRRIFTGVWAGRRKKTEISAGMMPGLTNRLD
jgi:AraC-like DNA-binding protein